MRNTLKKILGFEKDTIIPLALPKLFIRARQIAQSLMLGHHGLRKAGQGYDFWQFKPYEQGDDIGQIDWKHSAKSDNVLIRKKEWQARQLTLFWVSPLRSMIYENKYQNAALIALSLAQALVKSGEQIGLVNSPSLGRGNSLHYFKRFAESLSRQKGLNTLPQLNLQKIPSKSELILLHDFLEPIKVLGPWLEQLKNRHIKIHLVQILDSSEIDLNFKGRVLFEDMNSGHEKDLHNIESLYSDYKEEIHHHLKSVNNLAKKLQCDYTLYTSKNEIEKTILKLWISMTRRHHV